MMTFKPISELELYDYLKFALSGAEAIDTDRQLTLSTTAGRTRNARKWFVRRYALPSGRTDWEAGQIMFRAWTLKEALERLDEPRIKKRVDTKFGVLSHAD